MSNEQDAVGADQSTDAVSHQTNRLGLTDTETSLFMGVGYGCALGAMIISSVDIPATTLVIGGMILGLGLDRL